jgi:hypothetical protein
MSNKEPVKTELKKEVLKAGARADVTEPPLTGEGGGGQVQEFYALGEGSEPVVPTVAEVTEAVNNEAGK